MVSEIRLSDSGLTSSSRRPTVHFCLFIDYQLLFECTPIVLSMEMNLQFSENLH